jgi:hypothetical protein
MFHNIPNLIKERMNYLEHIDEVDRSDGTPTLQRLRQIPPETGKFLALMLSPGWASYRNRHKCRLFIHVTCTSL